MAMIQPVALSEKDARMFLGMTYQAFNALKRKGIVKKHPITRSYPVKDLERVLESGHEGEASNQKDNAAGRHEATNLQVRGGCRSKAGSRDTGTHPLDR
jgi:hypothetical protein